MLSSQTKYSIHSLGVRLPLAAFFTFFFHGCEKSCKGRPGYEATRYVSATVCESFNLISENHRGLYMASTIHVISDFCCLGELLVPGPKSGLKVF